MSAIESELGLPITHSPQKKCGRMIMVPHDTANDEPEAETEWCQRGWGPLKDADLSPLNGGVGRDSAT
jgi:hypothetical protein